MDVLFPESCRRCPYQRPVDGTCEHELDQTLRQFFAHNPDAPCPMRFGWESAGSE